MRARCLNLSLKSLGCLCSPTLAKQYITRLKKFQYRRFSASNLRPPPSPPQPAGCSLPHCWAKLSLRFPSCTPQPSGSLSQSLFLTIWKIFFNVDMVDSVHLLLLQLQKSIVGPGSGASLVVLAKAPPLSWCWCKPSSGVSVSSPQPAGVPCWLVLWWYSTAVTASLPASQRPLFCTTYLHQAGLHQRHNGAPLI